MRRMTPAKLLAVVEKRLDHMAVQELPIARFASMFYDANRYMGDKDKGIPASPKLTVEDFQLFSKRRKKGSLAAKDEGPGGIHNLRGAVADQGAWEAYAKKGKTGGK